MRDPLDPCHIFHILRQSPSRSFGGSSVLLMGCEWYAQWNWSKLKEWKKGSPHWISIVFIIPTYIWAASSLSQKSIISQISREVSPVAAMTAVLGELGTFFIFKIDYQFQYWTSKCFKRYKCSKRIPFRPLSAQQSHFQTWNELNQILVFNNIHSFFEIHSPSRDQHSWVSFHSDPASKAIEKILAMMEWWRWTSSPLGLKANHPSPNTWNTVLLGDHICASPPQCKWESKTPQICKDVTSLSLFF